MLSCKILDEQGVVVLEPSGRLQKEDFEELTKVVDAHLEAKGPLHGLVIHAESFPGWEDFAAFLQHLRFVKDHHRKIERVAAVTDGKIVSLAPKLVDHFVSAEVKHFSYDEMEAAMQWAAGGQ